MKVLVTGATGFVGKNLCHYLLQLENEVYGLTRDVGKLKIIHPAIKAIKFDLVNDDFSKLNLTKFDVVFNCAGEIKNEALMKPLHIDSLKKMLLQLKNTSTKWIQLSSVGVYGPLKQGKIHEDYSFNPVGEYEVTKAKADNFLVTYCKKHNITYSILRPSNIFGNDMPNESLYSFINQVRKGNFFFMGNPEKIQTTYVHITDVVTSLKLCAFHKKAENEVFIISDQISQKQFIHIICKFFSKKEQYFKIPKSIILFIVGIFGRFSFFPLTISRVNTLTTTTVYSSKKIISELGFEYKKGIQEGLVDYLNSKDW